MNNLREIQLFEFQMLKDVAKVCDENDIEYFMAGGTLLGAVRHGGFIPWDDDIDIYMTLKNYKKFLKIGQKILGDKYFVQNYRTDNEYYEMWTQIRANNTTSMPVKYKYWNIHFGICMDIFPIIGYHSDPVKRAKQNKAFKLNRTLLADKYMRAVGEPITGKLKYIYKIPRCLRRIFCKINEHNFMLDPDNYEINTELWYKTTFDYPAEIFKTNQKLKFEDEYFTAMGGYERFLSITFGDYMQLPPENQRGGHNSELGDIIMDIHKDYKEHKKLLNGGKR